MSNILDYLRWRGDLPLNVIPINEVDGLILAELSMMHWEYGLAPEASATLSALFPSMQRQPVSVGFTAENDMKLLTALSDSARFGDLRISDYTARSDAALETQFAAIAIHLPDGAIFVSFRGTDASIVGWKEDCNLAFSTPVPAQDAAREYLARIGREYQDRPLWVGGHSKGGNLAMYAAATADAAVRDRLLGVYNYDGPGLSDRMDAQALYARLSGRLHSCVPQGSIVGLLLAHPDEYTVVKSVSVGILQHDPYSWQAEGPAFVRMPELSRDSARFDIAFRRWLSEVDEADRGILIGTLFDILEASGSPSFGPEFWQGISRNPGAVMAAIREVDPQARKRVSRMLMDLAGYMLVRQERRPRPAGTPEDDAPAPV